MTRLDLFVTTTSRYAERRREIPRRSGGDVRPPAPLARNDRPWRVESKRSSERYCLALLALLILPALLAPALLAQDKPIMEIARDCQTFSVSTNNKIVCAVPHVKRIKKVVIQRADVWTTSPNGRDKLIVDSEKFMPIPPPQSYIVDSLSWSPDGSRIAMNMTLEKPAGEDEPASTTKAIALLDDEGHELKVESSKTRFFENAVRATFLADNSTVAYLVGAGPYKIGRLSTVTGQSSTLFGDRTFEAVVWDAAHNQAIVISQNLNVQNRQAIFALDLLHEGIREISRVDAYVGGLTLSPSGNKVGYYSDGDTIEVRDLANRSKPTDVRAGMGVFGWSHDERRVLLKRGPPDKSGELIWVGLYDNTFVPALHGLEYHAFAIAPDGASIAVTEPGREVLRVFPLQ